MSRIFTADEFLSRAEAELVKQAVIAAENRTSGEIRVHLDAAIEEDVLAHAAFVFEELGMHRTKDRNGILLYISVPSRRVAVLGDKGIHEKLGNAYWQGVIDLVLGCFREERYCEGLCAGVQRIGEQLREHFPHQRDDVNELGDEISIGR